MIILAITIQYVCLKNAIPFATINITFSTDNEKSGY